MLQIYESSEHADVYCFKLYFIWVVGSGCDMFFSANVFYWNFNVIICNRWNFIFRVFQLNCSPFKDLPFQVFLIFIILIKVGHRFWMFFWTLGLKWMSYEWSVDDTEIHYSLLQSSNRIEKCMVCIALIGERHVVRFHLQDVYWFNIAIQHKSYQTKDLIKNIHHWLNKKTHTTKCLEDRGSWSWFHDEIIENL